MPTLGALSVCEGGRAEVLYAAETGARENLSHFGGQLAWGRRVSWILL